MAHHIQTDAEGVAGRFRFQNNLAAFVCGSLSHCAIANRAAIERNLESNDKLAAVLYQNIAVLLTRFIATFIQNEQLLEHHPVPNILRLKRLVTRSE